MARNSTRRDLPARRQFSVSKCFQNRVAVFYAPRITTSSSLNRTTSAIVVGSIAVCGFVVASTGRKSVVRFSTMSCFRKKTQLAHRVTFCRFVGRVSFSVHRGYGFRRLSDRMVRFDRRVGQRSIAPIGWRLIASAR